MAQRPLRSISFRVGRNGAEDIASEVVHGRGTDAGGSPAAMRGVPNHPRGTHAATNEPHRSDGHEILHLRRGGDDSILAALRRRECGFNAGCAKPVGACSANDDAQGTVPHRPVHHLQHSPSCFVDDIAGRGTWVSRLALESTLEGHDGCVNTVTWHPNGKWAVSGSDDTMIKVWQPHAPASKRLLYSIPSGHTGNIFSTIFLDRTSWRSIASGAADGEVRWSLVTDGGCRTAPFYCHHGMVHSLASDPRSASVRRWAQLGMRVCSSLHPRVACVAQVFLSGSQDGTVRQFDVREPHNGNCQGSDLLSTCPNVLVDLRHAAMDGGAVGVREVVLNPMNPNVLVVAGKDVYLRVYDRRMLTLGTESPQASPLQYLAPPGLALPAREPPDPDAGGSMTRWPRRRSFDVTGLAFSRDGQDVVATYSGDAIYTFHVDASPLLDDQDAGRVRERKSQEEPPPSCEWHSDTAGAGAGAGAGRGIGAGQCDNNDGSPADEAVDEARHSEGKDDNTHGGGNITDDIAKHEEGGKEENESKHGSGAAATDTNTPGAGDDDVTGASSSPMPWLDSLLSACEPPRVTGSTQKMGLTQWGMHWSRVATASAENDAPVPPDHDQRKIRFVAAAHVGQLVVASHSLRWGSFAPPTASFRGHRNSRTVKEVGFYGPRSEYVVSGSDCGHAFIWSRHTGELVRVLRADGRITNVVRAHPLDGTTLVTSGIDYDVKLWSPMTAAWRKEVRRHPPPSSQFQAGRGGGAAAGGSTHIHGGSHGSSKDDEGDDEQGGVVGVGEGVPLHRMRHVAERNTPGRRSETTMSLSAVLMQLIALRQRAAERALARAEDGDSSATSESDDSDSDSDSSVGSASS